MQIKPLMCGCKQCKSSKKWRIWQRHYFSKYFRRKTKQNIKNGNFETINYAKIITYYTD